MPRPLWNGVVSFGLLNIPVSLVPGERSTDLRFRMLDSRDHARIRFERVNADTGEEVPWGQIVKAFEYQKGNYVVLDDTDFERAAPQTHESVEIESFVPRDAIDPMYFEKPYYLVPGKRADKVYVLLREVLEKTGRIAVARVVIRTREHLAVLMPLGAALVLMLVRYPQELIPPDAYPLPDKALSSYRVSPRELQMAEQLVDSMSDDFMPDRYVDDFRQRLHDAIERRIEADETVQPPDDEDETPATPSNVVDIMSLLKKSLQGGPKKSATEKASTEKASTEKAATEKAATGKAATAKAAAGKSKTDKSVRSRKTETKKAPSTKQAPATKQAPSPKPPPATRQATSAKQGNRTASTSATKRGASTRQKDATTRKPARSTAGRKAA